MTEMTEMTDSRRYEGLRVAVSWPVQSATFTEAGKPGLAGNAE